MYHLHRKGPKMTNQRKIPPVKMVNLTVKMVNRRLKTQQKTKGLRIPRKKVGVLQFYPYCTGFTCFFKQFRSRSDCLKCAVWSCIYIVCFFVRFFHKDCLWIGLFCMYGMSWNHLTWELKTLRKCFPWPKEVPYFLGITSVKVENGSFFIFML